MLIKQPAPTKPQLKPTFDVKPKETSKKKDDFLDDFEMDVKPKKTTVPIAASKLDDDFMDDFDDLKPGKKADDKGKPKTNQPDWEFDEEETNKKTTVDSRKKDTGTGINTNSKKALGKQNSVKSFKEEEYRDEFEDEMEDLTKKRKAKADVSSNDLAEEIEDKVSNLNKSLNEPLDDDFFEEPVARRQETNNSIVTC